jgi:hypothetical protein
VVEIKPREGPPRLKVRYTTVNNFIGKPVHPQAQVLLKKSAAKTMLRAHDWLKPPELGLPDLRQAPAMTGAAQWTLAFTI